MFYCMYDIQWYTCIIEYNGHVVRACNTIHQTNTSSKWFMLIKEISWQLYKQISNSSYLLLCTS